MIDEVKTNAMLQEMGAQRMILGDRAAHLAAELAAAKEEIASLKKLMEAMQGRSNQ